jgi:Secretion system C-terminal sorting domain
VGNTSVSTVKSVKFKLNGTTSRIDNQRPFAMKGTSSEDTSWPIKVGNYTLVACPYVQYYGWGLQGISKKISFKVVQGSVPSVANARVASSQPDAQNVMAETEEQKEPWSVYPVPVQDELTIELTKPLEGIVAIRIVNLQGQVVHSNTDYTNHFNRYVVSTNKIGLHGGFYIVQLQQGNGKLLTKKFFKE